MQGRLLPPINGRIQAFPKNRWPEEFPLARQLGFDCIEFIFDADDHEGIGNHPLLERGCRTVQSLVNQYGVQVNSICGDYFMEHPFHSTGNDDVEKSLELLRRLVADSPTLGITDIIIPCVDQSRLVDAYDRERLVQRLKPIVPRCEEVGVNLALETDLDPLEFKELLDQFESARITVNYDVGNSASLGYRLGEEWQAYGRRVSSVHVKDRLLGGPTVPLGTGSVKFDDFFRLAKEKSYEGVFIIQGARGPDDVATAGQYKGFVELYLKEFYGG